MIGIKTNIKPHELHYQVGNIVKIQLEPPKARRTGFFLGTKHVIVEPPENHINGPMAIWLQDKLGHKRSLQFMYWEWTGQVVKPVRKRMVKPNKRVRNRL